MPQRYNESNAFKVFGVMVRDTPPDALDVKEVHATGCLSPSAVLEVFALYLPASIPEMTKMEETV